ncbi:phosphoprotein ECPP44-like isoform X2 [Solanum tuberosum]|uniref:phosphoprotein ECPP44-like isoform X2 n=1 Tax=Solanum tuberosum TaxID=4113 RepID=UPI00073A165D|nr:PREDICTED: phosphoprotein ECPP44-like isoform X2 [Solanum tuberosum]
MMVDVDCSISWEKKKKTRLTTVNVEEKHSLTLMEAVHHTHSNSSSSSDDEEVEEGSTGEKKKGLKEKIKEKMSGTDHGQQENELIPMAPNANATHEEDKKIGLIDKIKENFPGHHNKNQLLILL